MTPHAINLMTEGDGIMECIETIEPSGESIRLDEEIEEIGDINGFPLFFYQFSSAHLPDEIDDTIYVVSAMVANAYPERTDFVMVAKTVRDENGRIIGCEGFSTATN